MVLWIFREKGLFLKPETCYNKRKELQGAFLAVLYFKGGVRLTGKNKNDIQHILRSYFLSLMLVVLGLLSILFSIMQYRSYRSTALESMQQACRAIASGIQANLTQMDSVVLNAISSNLTDLIEEFSDSERTNLEHFQIRKQITSLLLSQKGFDYSIRQLSIFSALGTGYGLGDDTGPFTEYLETDWYRNTMARNGRKHISVIEDSRHDYLSLSRAYFDIYHNPAGVVECREFYDDFFFSALQNDLQFNAHIIIYDRENRIIAANFREAGQLFPYYDFKDSEPVRLKNGLNGTREYAVYEEIGSEDFLAVMTVSLSELLRPISHTLFFILGMFALVFVLGTLLSGLMARRISNPIRSIYHFLSDKDSMHSEKLLMEPTNIREIDRLTDSINEYIDKSQEQTETIIALHEQEIQTQMLALQSQMNPHFLYNSLASIAEMAREGMADPVMVMTSNISEILRYISSNKEQLIPIGTELDICDKYLECMKIRFGDNLQYSFEIDDALWDLMIPKLCVQLLVENAIKSVTKQAPPWEISITGRMKENRWVMEVLDNGSGFDAAALEKLRSNTENILTTHSFPSLQINGSGLLNIFIRFYLIDKAPFIFEYGNRENGGAYVRVGRYIGEGGPA